MKAIGCGIVNVAMALTVAPLLEGIVRKTTAKIQSRQGPPLLQPYFDLLKLLGKQDLEVGEVPAMQRFAAYLALASMLLVAVLVPMGTAQPDHVGDSLLLIYLLTMSGLSTLLAGFAAGSPYAVVGASRGMMSMLALEPVFAVAILIAAVETRSLRLASVLDGRLLAGGAAPLAGVLMLGVMLFALQAFVERVPFDVAEAETEIMEGALVEYSGPKLALFKFARSVRLFVYCALFVALFSPLGRGWPFPLSLPWFLAQVLALVIVVTLVGATHARLRIDQAVRYYALMLLIATIALGLAVAGY
jgi:formate hydrogenlyase subunit 4